MILTDRENELKIELLSWDGDAYISASVNSHGFCGQSDTHILEQEFREFCKSIIKLQTSLRGEAILKSVSPDEISIKIEPCDRLGHLLVSGEIAKRIFSSNTSNLNSVKFGFEIEPQQLDKAIKVDWVIKYSN